MPLNKKNIDFWQISDNKILLDPKYLKSGLDKKNIYGRFKKITGTKFSAILGYNKYSSPFKTWMEMTNLFKSEMDPTLAEAGNVIEPKLREYAALVLKQKYVAYEPKQVGFDLFHENDIFGGIIDGEPADENGHFDYSNNHFMLEIKTSSIDKICYSCNENGSLMMMKDSKGIPLVSKDGKGKKKIEWFDENNNIKIPIDYQFQLALYMLLRNVDKGMFVVTFLEPIDYAKPYDFDVKKHEVYMVEFNIDDKKKFNDIYEYAKRWYSKYIVNGESPLMTHEDKKWLDTEMKRINIVK